MRRERSIPIGSHGRHVSERNKHLIRAGLATIGGGAVAIGIENPYVAAAMGVAVAREVLLAIDHQEDRKKGR